MAPCAEELAWFNQKIWGPILTTQCIGCHSSAGLARRTALVLEDASSPAARARNFEALRGVALTQLGGDSVLLLRPTLRHPDGHAGGRLIAPESEDFVALTQFVRMVTNPDCAAPAPPMVTCASPAPGARQLRRLSRAELERSIRDLTGVDWRSSSLAPDPVVRGFDNQAEALRVTPLLADQLRAAAEQIATEALRTPGRVLPCTPAAGEEPQCAARFIEVFGARAFRRPLTMAETGRYQQLYALGATDGFKKGVELVLSALLQSPHFLYRTELGVPAADGTYRLTPYEIASELSFLLIGTTPDEALLTAARTGALDTSAGIEAQARRLLGLSGARENLRRFIGQWLGLDRLATIPKDDVAYPGFGAPLRAALLHEAERMTEDVVFNGAGTLDALLQAPNTFLNAALATFYGVGTPTRVDTDGFGRASFPDPGRRGLLGLGAVLATHARPNSGSPIHRGKLVRERFLCQDLPPPPPGLVAQPPPLDPTRTSRQRYDAHSEMQPCASCHRLMDPIGFGFDRYDGIGRQERGTAAVDTRGSILDSPRTDGDFDGITGLAARLAESDDVRDCFAKQWLRFGYGVAEDVQLSCVLAQVQRRFRASGGDVRELLVALTQTSHFVTRQGEGSVGTPDGGLAPDAGVSADAGVAAGDGGVGVDGGGSPVPDAGVPDGGLSLPRAQTVTQVRDTEWPQGWCDRYLVTNVGAARFDWSVSLDVPGRITTFWDAEASAMEGAVTFTGRQYNRTLEPGRTTQFGFCAERR